MLRVWQQLLGRVYHCDIPIHQTLTDLSTRVNSVAATRPGTTTTTTPAPQVAEELQQYEDRLAANVQTLPQGTQQVFASLKQALDNIQAAIRGGRQPAAQDLQTFREQEQRLRQLLGGERTTATTEDVSGAINRFTNQMTTSWSDWRIGAGNVENAFDALNDLPVAERNQALTTLFRDNPDKVRAFMENLVEDKPDQVPNVMKWFEEAGLPAEVRNTYTSTYQANLRSSVVNVFTTNMTTGVADWQIGASNVENAYNILNDLSPTERGVALTTLFQNNQDKVQAFFANVREDKPDLALGIHNWFSDSNVSSQVRNDYNRNYRANLVSGSQEVSTFTSQMSTNILYDWRVGPGNVQNAYDTLNDLSSADRSTVLTNLFRDNPARAGRFFSELVEDKPELVKDVMKWFSDPNLSAEAKNTFIHGLKGENYGHFLRALNSLAEPDRTTTTREVIQNFGADCWNAKMTLERVRAEATGNTELFRAIGDSMDWLQHMPGMPTGFNQFLGFYGQVLSASAEGIPNMVVGAMERPAATMMDPHASHQMEQALGRTNQTTIDQMHTALNKWGSR